MCFCFSHIQELTGMFKVQFLYSDSESISANNKVHDFVPPRNSHFIPKIGWGMTVLNLYDTEKNKTENNLSYKGSQKKLDFVSKTLMS